MQGLSDVKDSRKRNTLLVLLFSFLSFFVMGYHPGLEDDGVYLAAVKYDAHWGLPDCDDALLPALAEFSSAVNEHGIRAETLK